MRIDCIILCILLGGLFSCEPSSEQAMKQVDDPSIGNKQPYLVVLGIAQDAGYPQAACQKDCCRPVWEGIVQREMVSCLGFVDPGSAQGWIFDATPDFKDQLYHIQNTLGAELSGIFLTHAHIGHYTGLMHLGREVMGADKVPVFAMPKMAQFLSQNGPWSQLISLNNIDIQALQSAVQIDVDDALKVTAHQVPHRDEFSETVGYSIQGPNKRALFIPDIDKWELWQHNIDSVISVHDYAFLDGSFFANGEIPGRDMSEIPHPFVEESLKRFSKLPASEKAKIHFIHFNHTNPLINPDSKASQQVLNAGMHIARGFERFGM